MCGDNTSSCSGSKGAPNSTVTWTDVPVDLANETLAVYNLSALDAAGDEIEIETRWMADDKTRSWSERL